jgi:hypothetical protein
MIVGFTEVREDNAAELLVMHGFEKLACFFV